MKLRISVFAAVLGTLFLGISIQLFPEQELRESVYLPPLSELLPDYLDQWKVQDSPLGATEFDSTSVREILKYDDAILRTYEKGGVVVTVHVVYWKPDSGLMGENRSHSPDFCFPASGWIAAHAEYEKPLSVGTWRSSPAQFRVFTAGGSKIYMLFWHLRAGDLSGYFMGPQDRWNARLPFLFKQFRRAFPGGGRTDEIFVRITSSEPFESSTTQDVLKVLAPALTKTGAFRAAEK